MGGSVDWLAVCVCVLIADGRMTRSVRDVSVVALTARFLARFLYHGENSISVFAVQFGRVLIQMGV